MLEAGTAGEALERLPDGDGLTVLRQIKERAPDTVAILMTAFSSIENAVEAMKLGAFHYVNKPFDVEEIVLLAEKALETTRLRREVRDLRSSQSREYGFDAIMATRQRYRESSVCWPKSPRVLRRLCC